MIRFNALELILKNESKGLKNKINCTKTTPTISEYCVESTNEHTKENIRKNGVNQRNTLCDQKANATLFPIGNNKCLNRIKF